MEIIKRTEKILREIDDSFKAISFLDIESMKEQEITEESIAMIMSDDYKNAAAMVVPKFFHNPKIIFVNPEKIIVDYLSNDEERVDDEIRSILYHEIGHYDTVEAYNISTDTSLKKDLKEILEKELLAFLYGFVRHWNSCKYDKDDEKLKKRFENHIALDRENIIARLTKGVQTNEEKTIHDLLENYISDTINFMNKLKCKNMNDRKIISYVKVLTNELTEKLVKQDYRLQ